MKSYTGIDQALISNSLSDPSLLIPYALGSDCIERRTPQVLIFGRFHGYSVYEAELQKSAVIRWTALLSDNVCIESGAWILTWVELSMQKIWGRQSVSFLGNLEINRAAGMITCISSLCVIVWMESQLWRSSYPRDRAFSMRWRVKDATIGQLQSLQPASSSSTLPHAAYVSGSPTIEYSRKFTLNPSASDPS